MNPRYDSYNFYLLRYRIYYDLTHDYDLTHNLFPNMPKNFKKASPGPSKRGVTGKFSYVDKKGIEPYSRLPALSPIVPKFLNERLVIFIF